MQPCRLPLPFHSRFYSSFHQWIDGRTLFPSHMVFEGYHSLFPHFPHPAEIEISGFCPDPDLHKITLAPSTVSLFSLGLFLSSIKLAEVKHVYKNSFTPLVLLAVGTGFLLSITNYLSVCQNNPEWNMHKILASYGVWNISWPAVHLNSLCPVFGALLLMALGIWLEKKIPVARKLSNYAPACFLIFVLHYPLIMLIPSHIWKQSFFAPFVLIPAIIFLIVAFYLFLRKFFPACLPYVANDRITHVPKKN